LFPVAKAQRCDPVLVITITLCSEPTNTSVSPNRDELAYVANSQHCSPVVAFSAPEPTKTVAPSGLTTGDGYSTLSASCSALDANTDAPSVVGCVAVFASSATHPAMRSFRRRRSRHQCGISDPTGLCCALDMSSLAVSDLNHERPRWLYSSAADPVPVPPRWAGGDAALGANATHDVCHTARLPPGCVQWM